MNDALDKLVTTGHLKVQPTSKSQLAGFLANADRRLADAQIPELSSAGRFNIAYEAAHALALAAMRAHGYRPGSAPGHRAIVFQELVHTVQAPATLASSLNRDHAKRNKSEYEGLVSATDAEALDMVALATDLKSLVLDWLRKHRPELLA
jgi:hypothetical protein